MRLPYYQLKNVYDQRNKLQYRHRIKLSPCGLQCTQILTFRPGTPPPAMGFEERTGPTGDRHSDCPPFEHNHIIQTNYWSPQSCHVCALTPAFRLGTSTPTMGRTSTPVSCKGNLIYSSALWL